ncbi:MAG TPA: thiamine phosphate synthase, partial [Nitrospira sp.]|nr:thiamine phosphate synthase [Nitrospira sp.]
MEERVTSQPIPQRFLKGLYLILDPSVCPGRSLTDVLREAAAQGVQLFQFRDKGASMKDAYLCARALRQAASEVGSLFIV